MTLFLEKGYDGASLEEVARRAGVSSATVYKHFKTKADLFGGVMERFWENAPDQTPPSPPAGDPRAGLLTIGRHYAALLARDDIAPLFRVIIAETPRFPELGEQLYRLGKRPYLERLNDYLAIEIDAGSLAIGDVPLATRQFLGMINDVVFWPRLLVRDLEISAAEAERVVAEAVETFLARYGAGR